MAVDAHEAWWPSTGRAGPHHAEPPPDPRVIDPVKAAQLRDLFGQSGWSGEGADLAILRALFCARIKDRTIGVPCWDDVQDYDRAHRPVGPKRFYVSTSFIHCRRYTESIDDAVRLIGSVLPAAGYRITAQLGAPPSAWLMWNDVTGRSHTARSIPLALLAALFAELAARPEAAVTRREP